MHTFNKRLKSLEQLISNLPSPPPPQSKKESFREFLGIVIELCENFGPEDCLKLLLESGIDPAQAADLVEKTQKQVAARMGQAKNRENLLYRLYNIFRNDNSFQTDRESALYAIVDKLPDAQKERIGEILKRIKVGDTHMLLERDLTVEDRTFLKTIFPKYYEW